MTAAPLALPTALLTLAGKPNKDGQSMSGKASTTDA